MQDEIVARHKLVTIFHNEDPRGRNLVLLLMRELIFTRSIARWRFKCDAMMSKRDVVTEIKRERRGKGKEEEDEEKEGEG